MGEHAARRPEGQGPLASNLPANIAQPRSSLTRVAGAQYGSAAVRMATGGGAEVDGASSDDSLDLD